MTASIIWKILSMLKPSLIISEIHNTVSCISDNIQSSHFSLIHHNTEVLIKMLVNLQICSQNIIHKFAII